MRYHGTGMNKKREIERIKVMEVSGEIIHIETNHKRILHHHILLCKGRLTRFSGVSLR